MAGASISPVGQPRNQQQGHQQRTEQGESHGKSHRREQPVLDALEREQRQVGGDDHQDAEEDRPRHLERGVEQVTRRQRAFCIGLAHPQDVFHHDDGAVHDDAEVDGAQRQQVGRHLEVVHKDERAEQRNRDRDRHDQRGTRRAQEQQQHQRHQRHALEERLAHRVHGRCDEIAAVDVGHHLDVLGQDVVVQVLHGCVHADHHLRRVLVLEQQRDALDGVGIGVLAQNAVAVLVAQRQRSQIAHEHGHALFLRDDDVAQVVQIANQADAAHHQTLLAAVHHAAARVGVVGSHRLRHLRQREVVFRQLDRVKLDQELRGDAAEVGNVHHAGNLLEARYHLPELQLRQLPQAARLGFQRVAVDFADGRSHGVEPGLGAVRQRHAADALPQALARRVIFTAVAKHHGDQRQAERALRAHHVHAGRAHDFALQRHGDLLLDLLGGQAVDLRDDLRGHVGDVRVSLQRQLGPAVAAVDGGQDEHQHDDAAPLETLGDEALNH